jgi:NTE family protein
MDNPKKVAIACQGGGTHAAFAAGVLTELLIDMENHKRFDMVGLSGTSAGGLCAMMAGYGLMPKKSRNGSGSVTEAIQTLTKFWNGFAASTEAEKIHNAFYMSVLRMQEQEVPVLGINMPVVGLNPNGVLANVALFELGTLGARKQYYDFAALLNAACPDFDEIDWPKVHTRVLLGASEIIDGAETVFDSHCNWDASGSGKLVERTITHKWRVQRELTLPGVAASGTLPSMREAEKIEGKPYWDGLYSQNPPIREFLAGVPKEEAPDEIWVVRINPQQRPDGTAPKTNAEIRDRENELMGNLSLNKELDFILTVNDFIERPHVDGLKKDYKHVTIRTIKMTKETATKLRTSSKLDRSRNFIDALREEGRQQARAFLSDWPSDDEKKKYPKDAAYY